MSLTASAGAVVVSPGERLEVLFEELAELAGARSAIDGRIVEIVAEIDRDELAGATGARSVPALVAWKLGLSSTNAHTIATIAGRLQEFPRCTQGMREGGLSADQVGVIAARAGEGSDEHYAQSADRTHRFAGLRPTVAVRTDVSQAGPQLAGPVGADTWVASDRPRKTVE